MENVSKIVQFPSKIAWLQLKSDFKIIIVPLSKYGFVVRFGIGLNLDKKSSSDFESDGPIWFLSPNHLSLVLSCI